MGRMNNVVIPVAPNCLFFGGFYREIMILVIKKHNGYIINGRCCFGLIKSNKCVICIIISRVTNKKSGLHASKKVLLFRLNIGLSQ